MQNLIEEFLISRRVEDVKESLNETAELEQMQKCFCVGHFLLYSFSKSGTDFRDVYQLVVELYKEHTIRMGDVEEGYS